MTKKQKLELTWIGKEKRPRLEPRILLEDRDLSYRAKNPPHPNPPPQGVREQEQPDLLSLLPSPLAGEGLGMGGKAQAFDDNLLIHGDNLLALKALEQQYAGKVKCVFIDPPYNTGSAFTHYDDGVEHSMWLTLIRDRLEVIKTLLSDDGSLWITIDDNECHYLKVLCDELFSRSCFIADIAWKRRDGAPNDRKIGSTYDHVLVYAKVRLGTSKKTKAEESFNLMQRTEKADSQYQLYEEPFGFDERGAFRKVDSTGNAKGGRFVESLMYPVTNPFTGEQVFPRKGRCWVYSEKEMLEMVANRRFYWGQNGKSGTPSAKTF